MSTILILIDAMRIKLFSIFAFLTISVSYSQPLCDFQGKDSLVAVIAVDTIHVWDLSACAYCSATFEVSVTPITDSIYIVQTDTAGRIATCDCLFNIRTSISGLSPGTYSIVVYRDLLKKYGYPSDVHQFIGSIQVNYQSPASPTIGWKAFQSECNPNSVPPEAHAHAREFVLYQNYPNPFNPTTTVRFETQRSEFVVIKLYDLIGREVQTLWAERTPPGSYSITFDLTKALCSGPYYCRMHAGSFSQTVMMMLLR
jgi:hypothetical protein